MLNYEGPTIHGSTLRGLLILVGKSVGEFSKNSGFTSSQGYSCLSYLIKTKAWFKIHTEFGVGKLAQLVEAPVTKFDDLSSILGANTVARENQFLQAVLLISSHTHVTCMHVLPSPTK